MRVHLLFLASFKSRVHLVPSPLFRVSPTLFSWMLFSLSCVGGSKLDSGVAPVFVFFPSLNASFSSPVWEKRCHGCFYYVGQGSNSVHFFCALTLSLNIKLHRRKCDESWRIINIKLDGLNSLLYELLIFHNKVLLLYIEWLTDDFPNVHPWSKATHSL